MAHSGCSGFGELGFCFREEAEDVGVVLEDDGGYGHGIVVVGVETDEGWFEESVFHYAEGGEDHCDAEGHEAEAADGGDKFVSAAGCVFGLPGFEAGVEVGGL